MRSTRESGAGRSRSRASARSSSAGSSGLQRAAVVLASLPPADRQRLYRLSETQAEALLYDWRFWARPEQLPPAHNPRHPSGTWRIFLYLAGRGAGKSRACAEWVRAEVESGRRRRLALVGRTPADVRDIMVEGEAGLLAISRPDFRPVYEPSRRRLTWPNGAIATTFGASEPNMLRGPSFDGAWADEIASWRHRAAFDNLLFGLRLGPNPQVVASTTPRPIPLIKELLADPTCVVTGGSSYDNIANLPEAYIEQVIRRFEGTRLGRQEIYAELLEDIPGALWTRALLERGRVLEAPDLGRIVVAVDPAISSHEGAAETGIIVVGAARPQRDRQTEYYVLDDLSRRSSPHEWAQAVVAAYRKFQADRIVAEKNAGGEMVEATIRTVDGQVPITLIHASRGKYVRAEPVAALYEQGLAHHVGMFPELEDEMALFVPGQTQPGTNDRMDALVHGISALMDGTLHSGVAEWELNASLWRPNPWSTLGEEE